MKTLSGFLAFVFFVFSVVGAYGVGVEENIYIPPRPPIIGPGPLIDTDGVITITQGWNLVAMPVLPQPTYTVKRFIEAIESVSLPSPIRQPGDDVMLAELWRAPYWSVSAVAVYKNGRFMKFTKDSRTTYNMVPGEAYFVYAEYSGPVCRSLGWRPRTEVHVTGIALDIPVSLNLNKGWNGTSITPTGLIGIDRPPMFDQLYKPAAEADSTSTAAILEPLPEIPTLLSGSLLELSKELVAQGIKAKTIAFWKADTQEWEAYELPFEGGMYNGDEGSVRMYTPPARLIDRIIRADEGFFLLCEENGLFIPGLDLIRKMQPYPGKRVNLTGIVEGIFYVFFGPPPPYRHALLVNGSERVFLKGANEEIDRQLDEALTDGRLRHVEGVMTVLINQNGRPDDVPGSPVDVLIVDKVELPPHRSYIGRVEGVNSIPEAKPPYTYHLVTEDGQRVIIPLKGATPDFERQLQEAASDGNLRYVEGVVVTLREFGEFSGGPADVLLVDTVQAAGILYQAHVEGQ